MIVDERDQASELRGERERRPDHRCQGWIGLPADGDGDDVDRVVVLADSQSSHAFHAVRDQVCNQVAHDRNKPVSLTGPETDHTDVVRTGKETP